MSIERPWSWTCHACGGENPAQASRCNHCDEPARASRPGPAKPPVPEFESWDLAGPGSGSPQGKLLGPPQSGSFPTSLLVAFALIVILIGVSLESKPLAVFLLIVIAPALLTTLGRSSARQAQGRPMSGVEKGISFLGTLAWTIAVLTGVVFTFLVSIVILIFIVCSGRFG